MKPFDLTEKKTQSKPPPPEHFGDIRLKYTVATEKVENQPGCWNSICLIGNNQCTASDRKFLGSVADVASVLSGGKE